jgi:hypothetical protein
MSWLELKLYYWKVYTWMARAVYKCSRLDPKAAYDLSSARTCGRLQL